MPSFLLKVLKSRGYLKWASGPVITDTIPNIISRISKNDFNSGLWMPFIALEVFPEVHTIHFN